MTTITTPRALLRARIESDDATLLEWWLFSPRLQLAWAVSEFGQKIMRLGNRIDNGAPNGNEDEAFNMGVRAGRRMGLHEPSRTEVEKLLTRLGLDSSDATMAKLGFAPAHR